MQVSSVSAVSGSSTSNTGATSTPTQKTLGMDDFMKLLATQFQQQDPMKPMDDTAFIAQTAQFSSLQQTQTLVQQMTQMGNAQDFTAANSYIGRQVTINTGSGATAVGNVTAVDTSGTSPQIIVNGQPYPLSAVLYVQPGAPATTPATSTPAS